MKLTLQIFSWIGIVMGVLAIFGSIGTEDAGYAILGGLLFFLQGLIALLYIYEKEA